MFRPAGNLITLRPFSQPRTSVHVNTIIDRGCSGHHRCGNGGFWTAFGITAGLGLFANIANSIWGKGGQQVSNNYQYSGLMPGFDYASFNRYTQPGTLPASNTTNQFTTIEKVAKDFGYKIIDNGDGTYTAYQTGDNAGEPITGSFEEVRDSLLASNQQASERAISDASEIAAIKEAAAKDTFIKADAQKAYNQLPDDVKAKLTEKGFEITETGIKFDGKEYSHTDIAQIVAQLPSSLAKAGGGTAALEQKDTVSIPNGWERIATSNRNVIDTESILPGEAGNYNIDGTKEAGNINDIENATTAKEVANYLMHTEMNMPTDMTVDQKLIDEIIKYNPSVFNKDGTVKENADWTKLDLPNGEYLESKNYLQKTGLNDVKWTVRRSPGAFSGDAWLQGADNNTYKIKCTDGDFLNYAAGKIQSANGQITTGYTKISSIVDPKTGKYLPVEVENGTGRIKVKVDDNTTVYLEDFLNNPSKYQLKESLPPDIPQVVYPSTLAYK